MDIEAGLARLTRDMRWDRSFQINEREGEEEQESEESMSEEDKEEDYKRYKF